MLFLFCRHSVGSLDIACSTVLDRRASKCYFYFVGTAWAPWSLRARQSRTVELVNGISILQAQRGLPGYCVLDSLGP